MHVHNTSLKSIVLKQRRQENSYQQENQKEGAEKLFHSSTENISNSCYMLV